MARDLDFPVFDSDTQVTAVARDLGFPVFDSDNR